MKKLLDFRKWFKNQYGKRPSDNKSMNELYDKLNNAKQEVHLAQIALNDRREWDRMYTAALHAYNAANSPSKEFTVETKKVK